MYGKKMKMKMGGSLKPVPSGSKGLSKLPTGVRNKMGFMEKGGMVYKHGGKISKRGGMNQYD